MNVPLSSTARAAGLIALALVLSVALAPLARAEDPFTVTQIRIDETAGNATEAQRRALESGQVRAAQILIERLTLAEDRLPDPMDTGTAESALQLGEVRSTDRPVPAPQQMPMRLPAMTAETAASLIAGFDIANERRSPTRYIGDLDVTFDRREVRDYLARYNVAFVQAQARPILVVPVLQSETGAVIWAGPWYEAWRTERFAHALVPFVGLGTRSETVHADPDAPQNIQRQQESASPTPLGRRSLTTAQAESLDETALRALAGLYDVDRVAVIAARSTGLATRAGGVLLDFTEAQTVSQPIQAIGVQGDFTAAAATLVEAFETEWKRQTIVREAGQNTLEVTLLYGGIQDWHALQTAVAGASLVSNARLDALSRTGAVMMLSYRGGLDQVRSELRSRGARLEETTDMGWTVRRAR